MPIDKIANLFQENADHDMTKSLMANMSFGPLNLLWTHDINNHLTVALSNLDRAAKKMDSDTEESKDRINKALDAIRKISTQCRVMTELLSRDDKKELTTDELASAVEGFFGSNLKKNHINYTIHNNAAGLRLPGHITQYLWVCNIAISNAKNAFYEIEDDRTPTLNFTLGSKDQDFVLRAQDNGPGMAEQDLSTWNQFFAKEGPVPTEKSSGLKQLYLISGIFGGSAKISNQSDQGHCLELQIPLS